MKIVRCARGQTADVTNVVHASSDRIRKRRRIIGSHAEENRSTAFAGDEARRSREQDRSALGAVSMLLGDHRAQRSPLAWQRRRLPRTNHQRSRRPDTASPHARGLAAHGQRNEATRRNRHAIASVDDRSVALASSPSSATRSECNCAIVRILIPTPTRDRDAVQRPV